MISELWKRVGLDGCLISFWKPPVHGLQLDGRWWKAMEEVGINHHLKTKSVPELIFLVD